MALSIYLKAINLIYNQIFKMEYSRESLDRHEKIQNLKDAGVICYANNYRGKQDIKDIVATTESEYKDVESLMENGSKKSFKTAGRLMSSRGM